mgnify:CR=1 FL=1
MNRKNVILILRLNQIVLAPNVQTTKFKNWIRKVANLKLAINVARLKKMAHVPNVMISKLLMIPMVMIVVIAI